MFPKKQQLSLILASGGEKWASEELQKLKSEGPSKESCEIIEFLARKGREDAMATILKIAIDDWNDAVVWGRIVAQNPAFFLGQKGYTSLCDSWKTFKFEGVRPT